MAIDLRLMARRVQGGDHEAFRLIVEQTQAQLFRLAARLLGDPMEAEDALQEAYVKAFRALRDQRYDGRAELTTWLYRIVTNTCIDALRKRKPVADPPSGREASYDGSLGAEARLALKELDARLAALPAPQRAAVVLKAVEGLSTPEVAAILGCSRGAVEQRLVRARAALRMKESDDE